MFSASNSFFPATAATDFATLYGAANRIAVIYRVECWVITTTAAGIAVALIKRSAANTGGTSTAPTIAQWDSSVSAATATALNYTANPTTLGAAIGTIAQNPIIGNTSTGTFTAFIFDAQLVKSSLTARSASEGFALNLVTGTFPSGSAVYVTFWWEEL